LFHNTQATEEIGAAERFKTQNLQASPNFSMEEIGAAESFTTQNLQASPNFSLSD
jgi:hypothetical protein